MNQNVTNFGASFGAKIQIFLCFARSSNVTKCDFWGNFSNTVCYGQGFFTPTRGVRSKKSGEVNHERGHIMPRSLGNCVLRRQ